MSASTVLRALRGRLLWFVDDPQIAGEAAHRFIADGLLVVENGLVKAAGEARDLLRTLPADAEIVDHRPHLIMPGFIDAHIHMPQTQVVASYGAQLMEWLNRYTFVEEQKLGEQGHAEKLSRFFLAELLASGTTTAAVYCSVHPQSAEAFFSESQRRNTRMIAGKVMMDRNAPDALLDTAETGYAQSKALLDKWHGNGRQLYCVTPRFAPSSTPEQLEAAGRLWKEHPGTYMQTHLCETTDEIAWVKSLFPERSGYLDVYHHAGLTGPRAIFGHAVHMEEEEFCQCHRTGSAIAHCPTSNLFLGSGLFRAFDAKKPERPVRTGVGTDLGAGTSFSQLQTLNEAYKVSELNGTKLTALHAFYLATRGGAEALYLDDRIGSVAAGYEADRVVIDLAATPLLKFRMRYAADIAETLFVLMTLGDDRCVRATYVAGEPVYDRDRDQAFTYSPS